MTADKAPSDEQGKRVMSILSTERTAPPAEPRVYNDRELLELFRLLLKSQIREERINSIQELYGLLRHVEQALAAAPSPAVGQRESEKAALSDLMYDIESEADFSDCGEANEHETRRRISRVRDAIEAAITSSRSAGFDAGIAAAKESIRKFVGAGYVHATLDEIEAAISALLKAEISNRSAGS